MEQFMSDFHSWWKQFKGVRFPDQLPGRYEVSKITWDAAIHAAAREVRKCAMEAFQRGQTTSAAMIDEAAQRVTRLTQPEQQEED